MAKLDSEKKAPSLAASALDNLPVDAITRRREFVDHLDQLEIDKKAAANDYAAHEKRLTEVFGVDKFVQSAVKKLRKMKSDHRALCLRQLIFFIKDLELSDPQLNLFNDDGQPGGQTKEKDEGAVFDKSANKAAPKASEREPVKKLTGAEPPKHVPSEGIPLSEAEARFKEANAKAEERRAAAPKHEPEVAAAAAKSPPRPPLKLVDKTDAPAADAPKAETTKAAPPKPPTTRSPAAAAKASERRAGRAPSKADVKATADKYFKKPGDAPAKDGDGEDDEAPGSYQVH